MAKKKDDEEIDIPDSTTVLFTALSVILLAFFILMNALGTVDNERQRKAIGSLLGTFGSIPGGFRVDPNSGVLNVNFMTFSNEEVNQLSGILNDVIDTAGLKGDLDVSINKDNLVFTYEDKILFKENSVELRKEAAKVLNDLISRFGQSNKIISVEGHIDTESYKNTTFSTDWEYAYARTLTIVNYFIQKGFPEKRLNLVCFGSHNPIRPNDTEDGRSRNRRTEFVVLNGIFDQNLRPKVKVVEIRGFKFEQPILNE